MKLCELTTAGLRVPDRTYSLGTPDGSPRSVTLVTGPPASGKTSLLYCIAAAKEGVAPYGAPVDARRLLRPGQAEGALRAVWRLTDEELARTGLSDREQSTELLIGASGLERKGERPMRELLAAHSREPGIGKLELFPAYRRLGVEHWCARQLPLTPAVESGRRLGADDDKYRALARVLHDVAVSRAEGLEAPAEGGEDAGPELVRDALAPYQDAVSAMVPGLRLVSVTAREGGVSAAFARADGIRLGVAELPTSEEQGVLFALAYAWLGLDHSIWLIDSPELGLASQEHSEFLARLARLGTDNQLIVATGSAALVGSARASHIVDMGGADARAVVEAARGQGAAVAPAGAAPRSLAAPPPAVVDRFLPEQRPLVMGVSEPPARRLGSSPWARPDASGDPFSRPPAAGVGPSSAEPGGTPDARFAGLAAPAEAAPAPPAAAASASVPSVSAAGRTEGPAGIAETQEVRLEAILGVKPAVPFQGAAQAPAPAVAPAATGAREADEARGPLPGVGETKEVSLDAVKAAAEAVPFSPKPRSEPKAPDLTIEQYASYAAEMAVAPGEHQRILAKYGIGSPRVRVALSVLWGKRFEDDPELKARFDKLQQDFVAWLRAQPR